MAILSDDVDKVREATDFVAVVSEHLQLRKVGARWSGLCPFHAEKSPSFTVNAEQKLYHCFGCQQGGDVFKFVMELEHLDFVGAVERLAARASITVRHDNPTVGRDRSRRKRLLETMAEAVDWYHTQLLTADSAAAARRYLRSRGYDGEAVRAFRLGWAPDAWDVAVRALALSSEVASDTGLGFVNKAGRLTDFFRNRILFPIFDVGGEPIAFGGRKLPDADGPKYKNSSETRLYSKSKTLYGLNWAKAEISRADQVIVCEGYTDVIAFHRAGMARAVATCGTALADEHFSMLKNFTRRIVLAYDADAAGQNAAAKFFEWEKRYEIELTVLSLPEGTDPADLARTDPDALRAAVDAARPFLRFRIDRLMSAGNLSTPEGRARVFEQAAAAIAEHPSVFVREQYLKDVADRCRISEEMMARVLAGGVGNVGRAGANTATRSRPISNSDPGPLEPAWHGVARHGVARQGATRATGMSPATWEAFANTELGHNERNALAWTAQYPDKVLPFLHASFFVGEVHQRVFEVLAEHVDVHAALASAVRDADHGVEVLLSELAVAELISEPEETVAFLVSGASRRVFAEIQRRTAAGELEPIAELTALKQWSEQLNDPEYRIGALNQLVPWLVTWATPQN